MSEFCSIKTIKNMTIIYNSNHVNTIVYQFSVVCNVSCKTNQVYFMRESAKKLKKP